MYKIGIVGRGFVGSAVEFGFSPQTGCDVDEMYIYDKNLFSNFVFWLQNILNSKMELQILRYTHNL